MPSYHAPIKDIKFILQNVLEINDSEIPGYSELDNEYLNAILEEASKILNLSFSNLIFITFLLLFISLGAFKK